MTPDQFEQLQKTLRDAVVEQVDVSVNGKIDRLLKSHSEMKESFLQHMIEDKETSQKLNQTAQILDTYIVSDNKWKEDAKEAIALGKNVSTWGKVNLKVVGFIGALGGLVALIMGLFKKL